jgi:hypothetical protein
VPSALFPGGGKGGRTGTGSVRGACPRSSTRERKSVPVLPPATSDDTSGVSSAPIDALLFEARWYPVVSPCGTSLTVRPVATGAVESASIRFLRTSVDLDHKTALHRPRVGGSYDWQLTPPPHDRFLGFVPLFVRLGTSSAERGDARHLQLGNRFLTMSCRQAIRKSRRSLLLRGLRSSVTLPRGDDRNRISQAKTAGRSCPLSPVLRGEG